MLDAQNYLRSKAKVCQPEQSAQRPVSLGLGD